MENEFIPYTQQSLLAELVRYFGAGIRVGRLAKTLVLKAGIDSRFMPGDLGFCSGQFHSKKAGQNANAEQNKEACIRFGILKPINAKTNQIFGAKQLIVPLYDMSGKVNNLYSFTPEKKKNTGVLYPEISSIYPALITRSTVSTLIVVDDPYHCVLINSWAKEKKLPVLSCFIYGTDAETKEWIERLHTAVFAQKVILTANDGYLLKILRQYYSDAEVSSSDMFDKESFLHFFEQSPLIVEVETKPEPLPEIIKEYSFTVVSPTLIEFRKDKLSIDVPRGELQAIMNIK